MRPATRASIAFDRLPHVDRRVILEALRRAAGGQRLDAALELLAGKRGLRAGELAS